jgi:hypothetical protein
MLHPHFTKEHPSLICKDITYFHHLMDKNNKHKSFMIWSAQTIEIFQGPIYKRAELIIKDTCHTKILMPTCAETGSRICYWGLWVPLSAHTISHNAPLMVSGDNEVSMSETVILSNNSPFRLQNLATLVVIIPCINAHTEQPMQRYSVLLSNTFTRWRATEALYWCLHWRYTLMTGTTQASLWKCAG